MRGVRVRVRCTRRMGGVYGGSLFATNSSRFESQFGLSRWRKIAYEHLATMSEMLLHADLALRLGRSIFLRKESIECATSPLAPASIVKREASHGLLGSSLISFKSGS